MQTFLPFPDFAESARCLDRLRLGKQRIEAATLLQCLHNRALPWANHPAAKMWRGYAQALACYGLAVCNEWTARGYADTQTAVFEDYLLRCPDWCPSFDPPWLGDPAFHAAHRAALLAKAPDHYGAFGWTEAPALAYIWPEGKPDD